MAAPDNLLIRLPLLGARCFRADECFCADLLPSCGPVHCLTMSESSSTDKLREVENMNELDVSDDCREITQSQIEWSFLHD